jgi:hypothetical protein
VNIVYTRLYIIDPDFQKLNLLLFFQETRGNRDYHQPRFYCPCSVYDVVL